MDNQKLTKSEKKRLDNLQKKINNTIHSYGKQKYVVEDLKERLQEEENHAKKIREKVSEIQQKYESYVQELYQKYGDVAVDLESGDILDQR